MRKLNLSEWANIAEISASIVLVFSLVYVGLELDRNTKAVHSDSWQDVFNNLIELDMVEAASEEISGLVFRGESTPAELTEKQWWRFSKFADSRLGQIEHAYLAKTAIHLASLSGSLYKEMLNIRYVSQVIGITGKSVESRVTTPILLYMSLTSSPAGPGRAAEAHR